MGFTEDTLLGPQSLIQRKRESRLEIEYLDKVYNQFEEYIPKFSGEQERRLLKDFTKIPYFNGSFNNCFFKNVNWGYIDKEGKIKYLTICSYSEDYGDLKYILKVKSNNVEDATMEIIGVRDLLFEKISNSKKIFFSDRKSD